MGTYDSRQKVLLIEDNPGDARLIEILLKESDFSDCYIEKKETLKDGMALLAEQPDFDAVMLDLSLPDSNGFQTLERFVAKFPSYNVIVLTGFSDKSMGLKAVQAGAQDFLVKGMFDSDTLSKSLRFSIQRAAILNSLEETQSLARIGNWKCDLKNNRFEASKEIYRIFGMPHQYGKIKPSDLQSEDHPMHLLEVVHQEAAILGSVKKDLRFELEEGKEIRNISVQCRVSGMKEQSVFQGVIQDISERKQAEQEMMKSRKRYQEIFSQSKDAIFICTLEGKLVDCNIATEKLFGRDKKALKAMDDLHALFSTREAKNEFLLKLKFQRSATDYEINVERGENDIRKCLISANLQEGRDFMGYNATVRDITEQKRTEELVKARDLAEESAKLKEQFMASISHEMRTPMNAIFGMSNLLKQTELNIEQTEYVKSINQSSEVLLGIVNDILEIATIQNGKLVFENEIFNLHDLLGNVGNVMQYKAKEKDLFLSLELPEEIPEMVKGDKLRINQIFFNLVGNAVKFTDDGYVKIVVEKLSHFEGGVHLKFSVEDTGIGIPKSELKSVFDSFSRVRMKDRIFEGTGLGLAIAKSLVEQQGGMIGAESEVGKGSKFFFDMIFETVEKHEIAEVAAPQIIDPNLEFRLLLVEDHKMNQLVARKTLKKKWKNIDITIANNGQEAVDYLEKETFDIVLMDVQMPIMDGMEATNHIRTKMSEEISKLPILAMTAHAHISKDEKYKEHGFDNFVLKPFEPEQLFGKIMMYLGEEVLNQTNV